MTPGHELVIDDAIWEELCERAGSPYSPRYTLLCPECIEELMGRPLTIQDLTIISKGHGGARIALPMNLWYYRLYKLMPAAWPYIIKSIKTATVWVDSNGKRWDGKKTQKHAWIKAGLRELESKV
jgi:hypothetical protein